METSSHQGGCGACCAEQERSRGLEWCYFPRHWRRAEWCWSQSAASEFGFVAGATTTRVENKARSGCDVRVGDAVHVRAEREFPVAPSLSPQRARRVEWNCSRSVFEGNRDAAMLGRCRGSSRDHRQVGLCVLLRARLGWTRSG